MIKNSAKSMTPKRLYKKAFNKKYLIIGNFYSNSKNRIVVSLQLPYPFFESIGFLYYAIQFF